MAIEILGWATSRVVARQFLELTNIADWNAEQKVMVAREGVSLHPFRTTEEITVVKTPAVMDGMTVVTPAVIAPGFHFNLRVYGKLEEALRVSNPAPDAPYWNRLKLKNYVDAKLGAAGVLRDKEVSGAKLPGGYEWTIGAAKVRLYDAAAVGQRANVWQ